MCRASGSLVIVGMMQGLQFDRTYFAARYIVDLVGVALKHYAARLRT